MSKVIQGQGQFSGWLNVHESYIYSRGPSEMSSAFNFASYFSSPCKHLPFTVKATFISFFTHGYNV